MRRRRLDAVVCVLALTLLAGCASEPAPSDDGSVRTLAKVDGWRAGLDPSLVPGEVGFAVLELAYDEAAVRDLWDAAVPDDLPAASGSPTGFGVHDALEDVDLADEVVGLWSSGQSGSCPGWLGSVDRRAGTVALVQVEDLLGGDGCTDDYNTYSQVVVLNRDQVPPVDGLPVDGQLTFAAIVDGSQRLGNGPTVRALITAFAD